MCHRGEGATPLPRLFPFALVIENLVSSRVAHATHEVFKVRV